MKDKLLSYRGFYLDCEKDFLSVQPKEEWDKLYPPNERRLRCREFVLQRWLSEQKSMMDKPRYEKIAAAKRIIDRCIEEMHRK